MTVTLTIHSQTLLTGLAAAVEHGTASRLGNSLLAEKRATSTVTPEAGLAAGIYSVLVRVMGDNQPTSSPTPSS